MRQLKNPRKYVERLKCNIKFLEDVRSSLYATISQLKGVHWFWHNKDENRYKVTWQNNPNGLSNRHVGDKVVIHGTITEIHTTLEGDSYCLIKFERAMVKE